MIDLLSQPALAWLPRILGVLLVVVLANGLIYHLLRRLERVAAKTANVWDDALVRAASGPVRLSFWLIGLSVAANIVAREFDTPLLDYLVPARTIGLVICLAWFLLLLISHITDNIVALHVAAGEEVDRTTVDALSKLARLVVLVVAVLVGLDSLGVNTSGMLAAGGIGGLAVGFAAKDLLANFFGGLTIYLDRPFAVGDWIRSPDKDIEGTVEYISWRHTRIRRFNKNPLYVPNALFTTIAVENPSRMSHRRLKESIGLRYADLPAMPAIVDDMKAMLAAHPDIDTSQTLIVNFESFGESSLNILVYCFTRTTVWPRYHEIKQDILLHIADIIARHGAEIAFPTRSVHLAPFPEGLPT